MMVASLRSAAVDLCLGVGSAAALYVCGAVIGRKLTIPWDAQHPPGNLFFLLCGITLCLTGVLAVIRFAMGKRRFPIPITLRLGLVVACVAAYEGIVFAAVLPRFAKNLALGDFAAHHPVLLLALDFALPAGVAGIAWWLLLWPGVARTLPPILGTTCLACVLVLLIWGRGVVRSSFEAAGWLTAISSQHLTGVHTPPQPRYLGYLVGAPLSGLPFALRWLAQRYQGAGV